MDGEQEQHGAGPLGEVSKAAAAQQQLALKQTRYLDAQIAQLGRARWRDVTIALAGAFALAAAGLFVWDASRADGVVVEPFAVPPDLAQRGLGGPVLATQFLDKLTGMQAQTESLRAHSTYANDWSDNIQVEIPKTGVSIGELRTFLRGWLGHQTRLSGEVFRLPDGRIAVTSRVGANPGTRSEGKEAELDALLQHGAEAVYAETQPYRYAVWLNRQGRPDEALAIFKSKLIAGTDVNDRLWGYNGLAALSESQAEKDELYARALRLRPDFAPAISNRALGWLSYGEDEKAYHGFGEVLRYAASARRELEPGRADQFLNDAEAIRALYVGDMRKAADLQAKAIGMRSSKANTDMAPMLAITQTAMAHDLAGARRLIKENGLSTPAALAERLAITSPDSEWVSSFAAAIGDWNAAAIQLTHVMAEIGGFERSPQQGDPTGQTRAMLAQALARSGKAAQARATIAPTALDCAYCVRARGLVEAYAGNPAGADRWLAQAARMTPSLPAAHNDWAEAYLVRRDPVRAIAQARLAVKRGPKWAEPRKAWGDALMMQGEPAKAAAKYAEAVRLTPGWGALWLAQGRAQAAAGKADEARISFQTAAALDLNAADRAAVRGLLGN